MEFDLFGLSVKDLDTRRVLAKYNSTGPLYTLPFPTSTTPTPRVVPYALATAASSATWHCRLGHPGPDVLSKLSSSSAITCPQGRDDSLCHVCQLGWHVRLPFPSSSTRAIQPFDLVHYDLWTSPIPSVSGCKYYLIILNDCTHYSWTFPLRQKSDTFPTLSHVFSFVSTQFGRTIQRVPCDNGRQFDNSTRTFFLSHNAQLRMSCPYTSPQNGKAERMIRTTNDVMHSLLFQASLPARYWTESLYAATYLLNLLPTKAILAPTPQFALFGTTPSYTHLRVFGCACYLNTSATAPHNLAPCSCRCVFLGYSSDHKGYRCQDLTMNRVLISRHVFDESSFPFASSNPPPNDLDSLCSSNNDTRPRHRRPFLRLRHAQPRLHASPSPPLCTNDDIRLPRRSPPAPGRRSTTPSPWLVTPTAPTQWSLVVLPGSPSPWIVYSSPPTPLPQHCFRSRPLSVARSRTPTGFALWRSTRLAV
jgi:hypothetical protein